MKKSGVNRKQVQMVTDELDVEDDVQDFEPPIHKRKIGGKKIPSNVPVVPLDNVSFHTERSVQKWRFVYQRRVVSERELHDEALK